METLIKMTDFVLESKKKLTDSPFIVLELINYAELLNSDLKLSMFVPCDESDEPLDEFIHNIDFNTMSEEWQKAKRKVLFSNCSVKKINNYYVVYHKNQQTWISWTTRKVEHMIAHNLPLTPPCCRANQEIKLIVNPT